MLAFISQDQDCREQQRKEQQFKKLNFTDKWKFSIIEESALATLAGQSVDFFIRSPPGGKGRKVSFG